MQNTLILVDLNNIPMVLNFCKILHELSIWYQFSILMLNFMLVKISSIKIEHKTSKQLDTRLPFDGAKSYDNKQRVCLYIT
jgi:hypothetical protein